MRVSALMTKTVHTCSPHDRLDKVARIMWENDVGAVPVVNEAGRTTAMITDRDLTMAAYTQGKPLAEIPVWSAASSRLIAVRPDDAIDTMHERMRTEGVRRMPVVGDQGEPVGIVSIADLARRYSTARDTDGVSGDAIALTLAAIATHRTS